MNAPIHHSIEALLDAVGNQIRDIKQKIDADDQQLSTLKEQGLIYAGTWMKAGKYMYLIYPSDGFGYRKREYIGSDPEAILKATQGWNGPSNTTTSKRSAGIYRTGLTASSTIYDKQRGNGDRSSKPD